MSEMPQRIGNLQSKFFGIADLPSVFSKCPSPMRSCKNGPGSQFAAIGKLFQKMMAEYVLHGLIYIICEVYIDALLIYGRTEEEFLRNVESIFEGLREYDVTLNPMKVHLGLTNISFGGHEIDCPRASICHRNGSRAPLI